MLADALGVSYGTLHEWVRRGVIYPSAFKVHSSGRLVPQFEVNRIQEIKNNLIPFIPND
jgi:predicted site-specific integrase-resolvase